MSSIQNAQPGEVPCPDPSAHSKLHGRQSKSSLYSTPSQANPLGPDGKLSSASAAQSLKYAQPHTLPSYPSHGLEQNSSSGTLSASAGKAALLASKDGGRVDLWQPGYSAPGHHAANLAMGKSGKLGPQLDYGYTDEGRSKALLAATTSLSRGVSGVKSVSRDSNASVNRSASSAAEASRVPGMKREMFTEHPPVAIEVEEKRKADALKAASTIMARQIYENQKKQGVANTGAPVNAGIDQYPGLHDLATKLAAERLAKIDPDGIHAYREHYGTATSDSPSAGRMSMKYRSFRQSMAAQGADEDDSDDEAQASRIRYQMSHFNDKLKGIDMQKRTSDRNNVLSLAQQRVQARLADMDEKVFADTGKVPPNIQKEWEAKAQEKAAADMQATTDRRMLTQGKVHVGGGKYMDQSEIDAIALARMQPTLDEITATAEKQRARDAEIKRDMEERRVKDEEEKQRLRAEKNEQKRVRDEEKARLRNVRDAEKLKQAEEKAQLKAEERARKNEEKAERDARMASLKQDRDARKAEERASRVQPIATSTAIAEPTTTSAAVIEPTTTGTSAVAATSELEESPHSRAVIAPPVETEDEDDEYVEVPSTPAGEVPAVGTLSAVKTHEPGAASTAQRALDAPVEGESYGTTKASSTSPAHHTPSGTLTPSKASGEVKEGRASIDPRVDGPSRSVAHSASPGAGAGHATADSTIADSTTVITPTATSNSASGRPRRESRLSKFMNRLKHGPSREPKTTPAGPTPQDPLEKIGSSTATTEGATGTSEHLHTTTSATRDESAVVSGEVTPVASATAAHATTDTSSPAVASEHVVGTTSASEHAVSGHGVSTTTPAVDATEEHTTLSGIDATHSHSHSPEHVTHISHSHADAATAAQAPDEHTAAILARVMGAPAEGGSGEGAEVHAGLPVVSEHSTSHSAVTAGAVGTGVVAGAAAGGVAGHELHHTESERSEGLYDEPAPAAHTHSRAQRDHSASVSSMSSEENLQRGRTGRSEVSDDEFLEARDRFDNGSLRSASYIKEAESASKFQEEL